MKVLLLADVNSPHIKRWGKALRAVQIDLAIFTLSKPTEQWFLAEGITIFHQRSEQSKKNMLKKLGYLKEVSSIRRIIKQWKPDIVHAHYASSYGMLGRFSGFHPFLISVWGSDVYVFPKSNLLQRKLLEGNLKAADYILSTSKDMGRELSLYTQKNIEITPFGVATNFFKPSASAVEKDVITIGTVKSLETVYGVDRLIEAYSRLKKVCDVPLKLQITGDGSRMEGLKIQAEVLEVMEETEFQGRKQGDDLVAAYQSLDIAVFPSRIESFGVAIAEASACGVAVIGSNVGGIPEIIEHEKTGLLVDAKKIDELVSAMKRLVEDSQLRKSMGTAGRQKIVEEYDEEICLQKMVSIYQEAMEA